MLIIFPLNQGLFKLWNIRKKRFHFKTDISYCGEYLSGSSRDLKKVPQVLVLKKKDKNCPDYDFSCCLMFFLIICKNKILLVYNQQSIISLHLLKLKINLKMLSRNFFQVVCSTSFELKESGVMWHFWRVWSFITLNFTSRSRGKIPQDASPPS